MLRPVIRRVIPVNALVLALALSLLAAAPTHLLPVLLSAVCFGVGFITITGLLTIWSVKVFEERPSAGLGSVLILIALGQVIGPVIAGLIAEHVGLMPVFYGGSVLALSSVVLRPRPNEDMQMSSPAHQAA